MVPTLSYRIWFTQRNGSTLLCKGLESTGVAGRPGETLNVFDHGSLQNKYSATDYADLRRKVWTEGSTPNGVFGVKHSWHTGHRRKVYDELLRLRGIKEEAVTDPDEIWNDFFPNCRHIFLTRRNKIRQAVSWWKAIKDQQWHLRAGETHQNPAAFYEEEYDFAALQHLLKEAVLREGAIQAYFTRHAIHPMTLVYEDFIQDFPAAIQSIVDYLGIDYHSLHVGDFYYARTADADSERWVQRFRHDLQEGMELPAW